MKLVSIFLSTALALGTVSCGMSQRNAARADKKASKAQESVSKRRLKLIDQYDKCLKQAEGDPQKVQACESYLKAAEALQ